VWTVDDLLCFSNENGVFAFDGGYADEVDYGEYVAIDAYWQTPCLYTTDLSGIKLFNTLSLLLDGDVQGKTGVKISARFDNAPWIDIKDYDAKLHTFSYADFCYAPFNYRGYVYSFLQNIRLSHKRGMGLSLIFRNDRLNEPFTLVRFAVDYFNS